MLNYVAHVVCEVCAPEDPSLLNDELNKLYNSYNLYVLAQTQSDNLAKRPVCVHVRQLQICPTLCHSACELS